MHAHSDTAERTVETKSNHFHVEDDTQRTLYTTRAHTQHYYTHIHEYILSV